MKAVKDFLIVAGGMIGICFGALFAVWLFVVTAKALPWPDMESSDDKRAELYKERSEMYFDRTLELERLLAEERAKR